jgi:putative NADH-flavin reductase
MHLTVFGATGPTGQHLIQQGLDRGYTLTAFVRNPTAMMVKSDQIQIVQGDAYNATSVERAIIGSDAVISVLGSAYSFKPIDLYSVGTVMILQAMQKHGVRRFLCTSSGAANPNHEPREGFLFGVLFKGTLGRTVYEDMRRMEQKVVETDLDWTIVRPARLIETNTITSYRVGAGYMLPEGTQTSRMDLADFLLQESHRNQYLRKAVAIATDMKPTRNQLRQKELETYVEHQ